MSRMQVFATFLSLWFFLGFTSSATLSADSSRQDDKYLFFFFYKEKNARTAQSEQIFDRAVQSLNVPVQALKINVMDPEQREIIARYAVERAPMPMALIVAPNGAITGGFPYTFTPEQLKNAMVSPTVAHILKGLQNRKLVFISVQNETTQNNEAAMRGIQEMSHDSRFANAIESVVVNPANEQDRGFLTQFGVNAQSQQAQTIFLAPPGDKINTYVGATYKEQLVADLQNAASGCCPDGCCPGGCCPGGRCGK